MNSEVIDSLSQIVLKENIVTDEPMSRHTTFRCGGPAALFLRPGSEDELIRVVSVLKEKNEPCMILGNGSNLLVSDKGYTGTVISLERLTEIRLEGETTVYAQAGALNSAIASFARRDSLTGFEFAAGIPGTIGGAMIMNAGAYGGEMKLITKSVRTISPCFGTAGRRL